MVYTKYEAFDTAHRQGAISEAHLRDVEGVAGNVAVVDNLHVSEWVHVHAQVVPVFNQVHVQVDLGLTRNNLACVRMIH